MRRYSLFSGRVIDRQRETWGKSPHYQILLEGGGQLFRVAVNTRSGTSHSRESDLLYCSNHDFRHEVTQHLATVGDGDHFIRSRPGGLALDYQRGGMVYRRSMRRIPASRPGPGNDLVDELDFHIDRLLPDSSDRLHAYGTRWGPEPQEADQVFGFRPGNGIHDVHMNQGNRDEHWHDNGIWSDGGLIFEVSSQNRWSAIFLPSKRSLGTPTTTATLRPIHLGMTTNEGQKEVKTAPSSGSSVRSCIPMSEKRVASALLSEMTPQNRWISVGCEYGIGMEMNSR